MKLIILLILLFSSIPIQSRHWNTIFTCWPFLFKRHSHQESEIKKAIARSDILFQAREQATSLEERVAINVAILEILKAHLGNKNKEQATENAIRLGTQMLGETTDSECDKTENKLRQSIHTCGWEITDN